MEKELPGEAAEKAVERAANESDLSVGVGVGEGVERVVTLGGVGSG